MKCPKCGTHLVLKMEEDLPRPASGPDHLNLKSLLDSINEDSLEGAAKKFVTETRERFEQYGNKTRMSEKQMAWLGRIAGGETGRNDDEWN